VWIDIDVFCVEGIVLGLSQKLTKIEEEMVQSKHTIADMNAINDKGKVKQRERKESHCPP
jgi:hypothetical protein